MRTAQLKYILLVLAIIIWGVVFFRIYRGLNPAGQSLVPNACREPSVEVYDTLLLNYRDPFAINFKPSRKIQIAKMPVTRSRKKTMQAKSHVSLNVKYLGCIVRDKGVYSILEFSSGHMLLQKGDTVQGIKIVEIFDDSLKISSGKTNYTIIIDR